MTEARRCFLGQEAPSNTQQARILPNRLAAQQQNGKSLEDVAREILEGTSWQLAQDWQVQWALEEILHTEGSHDPAGMAVTMGATLASLFSTDTLGQLGDSPRQQRLRRVGQQLLDRLEGDQLIHPSRLLYRAAEWVQPNGQKNLHISGYPRLGQAELVLLDALAGPGSALELPYADPYWFTDNQLAANWLAGRGWEVVGPVDQNRTVWNSPGWQALTYPDQESEVRGVLGRAREQLLQGKSVVLVARNEERYRYLVQEIGWEYGLQISVGGQAGRLGPWLASLRDLLGDQLEHSLLLAWFSHPAQGLASQVARVQRAGLTTPEEWEARGFDLARLRDWPLQAEVGEYARRLQVLVNQTPWLARHDTQACQKLDLLLAQLLPQQRQVALEAFFDLLLAQVEETATPAAQATLALHTPLAVYGTQWNQLFWLGAVEGQLPATVQEDPLLPFMERNAGMESAEGAARREWLTIWGALQTAQSVQFSCPQRWVGRSALGTAAEKLLPSSLLEMEGVTPVAASSAPMSPEELRQAQISQQGQTSDLVMVAARKALQAERARRNREAGPYGGQIGRSLEAASLNFSASQLSNLGQCPYRWYASARLGLRKQEQSREEMEANVRGSLLHGALDLAVKWAREEADPRAAVLGHLEKAFDQTVAELREKGRDTMPATPLFYAYREELLMMLQKVVQADDFWKPGHEVVHLEYPFHGVWEGLPVTGLVDRIDRRPDGSLLFIDYKSSKSYSDIKDAEGKLKVDLQLPLYSAVVGQQMAQAGEGGSVSANTSQYFSMKEAEFLRAKKSANPELLAQFARDVVTRLQQGNFPVEPDVDFEACRYCDFSSVCRVVTEGEQ